MGTSNFRCIRKLSTTFTSATVSRQRLHDELVTLNYIPHVQSREEEAASLKQSDDFKAHSWVVERTHSWLNHYRRLLVRWDKK